MGLWQSLTRRRNIPEVPAWVAAAALLLLAAYSAWAAIRPEGPPVTDIRDPADRVRESRELTAHGEALVRAVRENDQLQVEHLQAEFEARSRREAEREGNRAAAVTAARTWYGLIATLTLAVGVWLLVAARKSRPG